MRLGVKINIQQPSGTVVEGIRVGDQFIQGTETELIEYITGWLQNNNNQYFTQLKTSITRALVMIGNSDNPSVTKKSYQSYLNFERALLGLNKVEQIPTSLLSIVTSPDSSKEFIYKTNIKNALGKGSSGSIYSGIKGQGEEIKKGYHRLMASQVLSEHLIDFIKTVQQHPLYSNRTADKIHGFAADAFMQHVAKKHADLLLNSVPKTTLSPDFGDQDTIDNMVKESLNSTRWTSGGDVIIIDKTGQVILNVQIKASLQRKALVGHLTMNELKIRLTNIQRLLQNFSSSNIKDCKELAYQIYNMYKTSAIIQDINKEIDNIANTTIKKGLYL